MLRIQQVRFPRTDAEEAGIETIGFGEDTLGRNVVGMGDQLGSHALFDQLVLVEPGEALASGDDHVPELIYGGGTGESTRHADDGDAVGFGNGING